MATLISVHNSDGCVGRCDAKCYNAKHDGCTCVCGGRNHGAGLKQAMENTKELADEWIERYTQENNLENWLAKVPARDPNFDSTKSPCNYHYLEIVTNEQ